MTSLEGWGGTEAAKAAAPAAIARHSTHALPVWHKPVDDLGGGSAWAAGIISALHFRPVASPLEALRRADLLSALCMNTPGDFSAVTQQELAEAEAAYEGREARLVGAQAEVRSAAEAELAKSADAELVKTAEALKRARVLAILRVKDPSAAAAAAAVARGVELASLGCRAIEVTLDSPRWEEVLGGLHSRLAAQNVSLGVGTVMDETVHSALSRALALGARFALSPIEPVDFVSSATALGILPIPSALTTNEIWDQRRRGVLMTKLFHAGLYSPKVHYKKRTRFSQRDSPPGIGTPLLRCVTRAHILLSLSSPQGAPIDARCRPARRSLSDALRRRLTRERHRVARRRRGCCGDGGQPGGWGDWARAGH